jgi:hypothetical protein
LRFVCSAPKSTPTSYIDHAKLGCPDLLTSPTNATLIARHKGTAEGRQTTCQAVALGRNPAHGHGKAKGGCVGGWGRSHAFASKLQWHSMYLCGRQKLRKTPFICPKPNHMHPSRRNHTTHTHCYYCRVTSSLQPQAQKILVLYEVVFSVERSVNGLIPPTSRRAAAGDWTGSHPLPRPGESEWCGIMVCWPHVAATRGQGKVTYAAYVDSAFKPWQPKRRAYCCAALLQVLAFQCNDGNGMPIIERLCRSGKLPADRLALAMQWPLWTCASVRQHVLL